MFSVAEEKLSEILEAKKYQVPFFQRPYMWGRSQCEQMVSDLRDAWKRGGEGDVGYFMGSIVLVYNGESERRDIIDGQQRLLTLQLLLSSLQSEIENKDKASQLKKFYFSDENTFVKRSAEVIVAPPERVYREYVDILNNIPPSSSNNPKFIENRDYFAEFARGLKTEEVVDFASFILNNVAFAVLSANSKDMALRVFSVLNNRGLSLHSVDIIKAELLQKIGKKSDQVRLSKVWEDIETEIGRRGFEELFSHIRMCIVQRRSVETLHHDIVSSIAGKSSADEFISRDLEDYADAWAKINDGNDSDLLLLREVGKRSRFSDWTPVALFIEKNRDRIANSSLLITNLTFLIAVMAVNRVSPGLREGRFGKIIQELEASLSSKGTRPKSDSLLIKREEFKELENRISTDFYLNRGHKALLILLEAITGDGNRSVETADLTIEHILPREPSEVSGEDPEWEERFDRSSWIKNANRLGNLCLVTGRSNRKMARAEFSKKKEYLRGKGGSQWKWTQYVIGVSDWTVDVIIERENKMISEMKSRVNFYD
ncbi:MAG: DUF262 domain-containing HNH endonuclease family protein [Neomegalonema sp.]|nr:DUF262 domain-containing HNH endonuclease family protein [Neomegalonema sp.]